MEPYIVKWVSRVSFLLTLRILKKKKTIVILFQNGPSTLPEGPGLERPLNPIHDDRPLPPIPDKPLFPFPHNNPTTFLRPLHRKTPYTPSNTESKDLTWSSDTTPNLSNTAP